DCYRLVDNTSDTIVIDGIEYDLNEIPSEITRVLDNGNLKWLDTKNVACDSKNGDTCNSLCIVKDITESKSKEMEIEKLRLDFFTNLSHELRTPINLILSSLQVLELKKSDNKEEDYKFYRKYLKIIKQNGFRLLKLVNNLIDSTKLDSGSFSYNPKNMNIIKCVEDICLSVCDFAKHNNIELIFDTDVEEKIISFDMDDLERILLNLISNAIKFSKEDGSILVSIDTSDLNEVKISVKDDGIGIPNDKLDVIFNKFEPVKSKMKNEREGSGIGLSLVKSLVQMHNGRIEVKSKVGQGSEFMVFLPNKLTENEVIIKEEKNIAFNNVYNMEVEFSDIY
ncbi:MAG: sensor histidine kinase, partial [Peptostreptococcaceae bacterium]